MDELHEQVGVRVHERTELLSLDQPGVLNTQKTEETSPPPLLSMLLLSTDRF